MADKVRRRCSSRPAACLCAGFAYAPSSSNLRRQHRHTGQLQIGKDCLKETLQVLSDTFIQSVSSWGCWRAACMRMSRNGPSGNVQDRR